MKTRKHKLGRGVGALAMTLLTAFTCVCSVSAVGAEESAGSRLSAESKDKEHIIYEENFDPDDYKEQAGQPGILPRDWKYAGSMPGTSEIYINDESDECYYGIARGEEEKDSSYVGIVYADYYALPDEYTVSFEMKYGGGDIEVLAYENRLNGGNLAVRSTFSDGAFSVVGADTESCNLTENDRFCLSYKIDCDAKIYRVEITDREGKILYITEDIPFYNQDAKTAGSLALKLGADSSIDIFAVKVSTSDAGDETPLPDEDETEGQDTFYAETFESYSNEMGRTDFVPEGWEMAGNMPGTAAVRSYGESGTEENGYYYELSRTQEENGNSYVGMKLTSITLPDEYTVSADVNYANTGDIEFFMRDSSLNSGKVAVRAGITQSDNGGTFYAYSGRDKKIIMSNVAENGWFKLSFYVDNFTGTYYVTIRDIDGNTIAGSEEMNYYDAEPGRAAAFAVTTAAGASVSLDNVAVTGKDEPYVIRPVEETVPADSKVSVTYDPETEAYIMRNEYVKLSVGEAEGTVDEIIRYMKDNGDYEDGGYNILGPFTGYYLLNYTVDGERKQCGFHATDSEIVKQEENYCEIVLTMDDIEYSSVAVELHFVLTDDAEGFYMYAYHRRAVGAQGEVGIEQSRYSLRMDSRMYQYSAVANEPLSRYPEADEYCKRLMDATDLLNDGSTYTKYQNSSYQFESITQGSYGDVFGLSLITPQRDWAGGGYSKQDIDVHDVYNGSRILNWHLSTSHGGTGLGILNDDWQKMYGPVLWYSNYGCDGPEALRQDAQKKAQEEIGRSPYEWVEDEAYSAERGSVCGKISARNGEVVYTDTDISPSDTYGWAVLSDIRSESWMKDNTYYEYYAPVREDGTFEISKIRPGSYRLNISLDGIMGEYEYDDIVTVDAGGKVNVGSIQWDNEVNGDTLWTIGIPDRTGEEFAYADSYRHWGIHLVYDQLFPEGVNFYIGESKESEDWFFVQTASPMAGDISHYDGGWYYDGGTGLAKYDFGKTGEPLTEESSEWKGNEKNFYNIFFDSAGYEDGTATLLIAKNGARDVRLCVSVNGTDVTGKDGIEVSGGGAYPRCMIIDQPELLKVTFDAKLLKNGQNQISLSLNGSTGDLGAYANMIYDAIRLDVDGTSSVKTEVSIGGEIEKNDESRDDEENDTFKAAKTGDNMSVYGVLALMCMAVVCGGTAYTMRRLRKK